METFGENFRGGKDSTVCPICKTHIDSQSLSLQCQPIKANLKIVCDISDIYGSNISKESVDTITKISKYRKETL